MRRRLNPRDYWRAVLWRLGVIIAASAAWIVYLLVVGRP